MHSPNYFIIKPYNGVRYDNIKKFGDVDFVMSSSVEDHTVTNRFAVVQSTPSWYEGPIIPGDVVVVHHNTFRLYYDMDGREASSWTFYKDDIYLVDIDQMYLYRRDEGPWKAIAPYAFVKPQKNENDSAVLTHYVEKSTFGHIVYLPEGEKELEVGMEASFKPGSEYEFKIDGEKLYRMRTRNICLTT